MSGIDAFFSIAIKQDYNKYKIKKKILISNYREIFSFLYLLAFLGNNGSSSPLTIKMLIGSVDPISKSTHRDNSGLERNSLDSSLCYWTDSSVGTLNPLLDPPFVFGEGYL